MNSNASDRDHFWKRRSLPALIGLLIAALPVTDGALATTRIQKEFDKWLVSCVEPDEGEKRCFLVQSFQAQNRETKKSAFLFSWTLSKSESASETMTLRMPLGVDLVARAKLTFPDSNPLFVDYTVCNTHGCFGEFPFEGAWSKAMQDYDTLTVEFDFRNGAKRTLDMDLTGFAAAYSYFQNQ